ncbi:ESX conserved componant EccB4, partial [Mycobacterium numidiamassiliense]
VAPDVIRDTAVVNTLPVATFPAHAPTSLIADGALCATWVPGASGYSGVTLQTGALPPVPGGRAPVMLSQADGHGPALDAVYLPPGRSAYVRAEGHVGARYLIVDTGVRFAIHDDDAARDLGLPPAVTAIPLPLLAALPAGPELSKANASVARDTVATAR